MSLFSCIEIHSAPSPIQYRREYATGLCCRISPYRGVRGINAHIDSLAYQYEAAGCPFCRSQIFEATEPFSDGEWITRGESVTLPNRYPYADLHTVTIITEAHMAPSFSARQLSDALAGSATSLVDYPGYPSINWNFLPSSGASLLHPHLQGIADPMPTALCMRYLEASAHTADGDYWELFCEEELHGSRHLFGELLGEEPVWFASPVPIGECEIRGILPVRTIAEFLSITDRFATDLERIISLYRGLGFYALNMGIFFQKTGSSGERGMHAFSSIIARINPNPDAISDSAFMERISGEPIVMTLPEDIPGYLNP
ncbi:MULTISPECIES: galactose-1-phosphate uridylyltransferase [Methanocalculus]|uniref:galactose-1-phosphate uridylyltransferase n=1 Tax=Methanocalculus TaxID=71151 RepID=UPI00209E76C5|nr:MULTISPECIES: galactose-1-phosphate uridylyltransferase [unclassified Methanocalculus]MCP1662975.1 galactose-1-phosphate uridylyltransferase [Methanocalculus sp. AMF5]